ncbi:hypothetical protein, partial [Oxalicibacterium solurbis]|uniref:hypothetical protein n=1 Tax=Oxalicibacterium solurbis TaxID=69280 RepID=UPI001E2A8105
QKSSSTSATHLGQHLLFSPVSQREANYSKERFDLARGSVKLFSKKQNGRHKAGRFTKIASVVYW